MYVHSESKTLEKSLLQLIILQSVSYYGDHLQGFPKKIQFFLITYVLAEACRAIIEVTLEEPKLDEICCVPT